MCDSAQHQAAPELAPLARPNEHDSYLHVDCKDKHHSVRSGLVLAAPDVEVAWACSSFTKGEDLTLLTAGGMCGGRQ